LDWIGSAKMDPCPTLSRQRWEGQVRSVTATATVGGTTVTTDAAKSSVKT